MITNPSTRGSACGGRPRPAPCLTESHDRSRRGREAPVALSYDRLDYQNPADRRRVVVEWEMSSVCNYSCSYCPPQLHDGRVRWPDFDVALQFCRRVFEHYRSLDITFLFSGGTVNHYTRYIS